MFKKIGFAGVGAFFLLPALAMADSLLPSTYSATLGVGGTATVAKTLTITHVATAPVDVFFLTDATGSMGGTISTVQSNVNTIISNVAASASNVAFGAGEYRDNGDAFVYQKNIDPTTSAPSVQAAVNAWVAGGGGDTPEANLYALQQVATTTDWRTDSTRLLMWFGDAPGHDPSGPTGVTEAGATAALNAADIATYAISVGYDGLNDYGQALGIATATGGAFYSGINATTLTNTIIAAITGAVTNYNTVGLAVIGAPSGVSVSLSPEYTGTWDRSIERQFHFDVGFTGVDPGMYSFEIVGLVNGSIVARESDTITVGAVPEPASMLLLGTGLIGLRAFRKRRK